MKKEAYNSKIAVMNRGGVLLHKREEVSKKLTPEQIETSQIDTLIVLLLQKAMTIKAVCRKLNISITKLKKYVSKINKMPIEFLKEAKRYKITIEDDLVSLKTLYWDKDGNKDRVQELHDNTYYSCIRDRAIYGKSGCPWFNKWHSADKMNKIPKEPKRKPGEWKKEIYYKDGRRMTKYVLFSGKR